MKNSPQRKTIRLERELYQGKDQAFFITIRTHDNRSLLDEFGELVFKSVMEGPLNRECDLMAVCVMLDHIHLLMAPLSENLIDLIGRWKSYTTHLMCSSIPATERGLRFLLSKRRQVGSPSSQETGTQ